MTVASDYQSSTQQLSNLQSNFGTIALKIKLLHCRLWLGQKPMTSINAEIARDFQMSALSAIISKPNTLPSHPEELIQWGQLAGASAALALSEVVKQKKNLVVVITPDMLSTVRLEQELKFFLPQETIITFPDWETLPYDSFSPHQDIISQRLLTLYRLPQFTQGILLVPINTLFVKIAPRGYVEANSFVLAMGDQLDIDIFRKRLESHGYRNVSQVLEHGEFAVRGSILDIFPMGSRLPYRVELFDNEVETLRTFDPENQRSLEKIDKIDLLPAREFPLNENSISQFRQNWRARFSGNPSNSSIYQNISQGESAPGIEYYLPLFFQETATLFDYFPANTALFRYYDLHQTIEKYWQEIRERYDQLGHDITKPLLPPQEIFLSLDRLFGEMKRFPQVQINSTHLVEKTGHINFPFIELPDLTVDRKLSHPLAKLQNFLQQHSSAKILFTSETLGRRESMLELLNNISITPTICLSWQEFSEQQPAIAITTAILEQGLHCVDPEVILIPEAQLYGQQVLQRRLRKQTRQQDPAAIVRDLTELSIGAPVVHIDHGIGKYLGLQIIKTGEIETEYLTLEYAEGAKLYVPVSSLHLISRYTGMDSEHTHLHRLGSQQWEKEKRKVAEKIRDVAAELLDIYAKRAAKTGSAIKAPQEDYQIFASSFPFEETPDQARAIQEVLKDMTEPRVMDRLVCGDVGFGKTEVAMRASFLAVQDHKQVAILVPTTLLAEQHYQNFKDRFANWPIRIAVLSRFHADAKQKQVLQDIAEGKTDIIIGTHKLLQPSVKFKNLGLLILDEEHRFGVTQKEKIKALRSDVDILTLTATPIPRTLNMALAGMRDLSLITTPPSRRLAIKTFVHEHNDGLIREAIMREILRGGQVYFLHNDIATIGKTARELQQLIPEARIAIGHGQMPEKELSHVMSDFYHQRFNVLVCTTIVESGIDVPTANTIIIDRADKFGLAQLHQLRGRVGRSHHQAYAYLLIPSPKLITTDAKKRLDAIANLEDLGAGFMLASHDLEIRGAGELLGEEQSGHIQTIGFSLYMELLEEAVNALKNGKQFDLDKTLDQGVEIELHIPALIPENLVADVHIRLSLYKRIANAKNSDELRDLQVEMIDRFGLLPEPVKNLFRIAELKLQATHLGIKKMDVNPTVGKIEFKENPNIDLTKLIQLVQKHPTQYKLDTKQRLIFTLKTTTPQEKFATVETLFNSLRKS